MDSSPEQQTGLPARGARVLQIVAPATGDLLGTVPISSDAEVRAAVERARAAQAKWAELPISDRCEAILGLRDLLVDRAEELVALLSQECGKPKLEALTHEIMVAADLTGYYAKRAARILAPREIELHLLKHRKSYLHYAPRGVVGIISPWNFPFVIPFGDAITALIAGNSVVIKPSEATPLIAIRAKEIFDEAGLPPDLLQIVTGDAGTGAALIDARPDFVLFTGAVSSGRKVAAACGERLIPCTLELGGKAAAIVCEDADVERTARSLVYGGFANSGQACLSVERVFAVDAIHDRLLERVVGLTRSLRQGPPEELTMDVGAMVLPRQIDVVEELIADAVEHGAEIRVGAARPSRPGQFYEPTVVAGCTEGMRILREEIFGPVIPFMRVGHVDDAIRLANDSDLGLMGYIFTKDREKGRRLAERVRAGTVMVNDVLAAYGAPETPFGGVKNSGFGRIHGEEGLRAMCELRHVNYDRVTVPRDPIRYPYGERSYRAALKGLRLLFRRGSPVKKLLDLF